MPSTLAIPACVVSATSPFSFMLDAVNNIDSRLIQTVILLRRQHVMTKLAVDELYKSISEFEELIANGSQYAQSVYRIYLNTFSLIDNIVRYKKICMVIPRISQKRQEYKELKDGIDELINVRNQFQHINNDIENTFSGPLLGSICWVKNNQQYLASFHDLGRKRDAPGIPLNMLSREFIYSLCFVYNEKYHDLKRAIDACESFNNFITESIELNVDGKIFNPNDHFIALKFGLVRV